MNLRNLRGFFIVAIVAVVISGCTQPEVREERIEADIQRNWKPQKVGDLTREQAFKECNAKAKSSNVASFEFYNWDVFMRTCMRDKGFAKTR
jgi:hypothetical protein